MKELEKTEDYFPYIGHEIDQNFIPTTKPYIYLTGTIFEEEHISRVSEDILKLNGEGVDSLYSELVMKGIAPHIKLAQTNDAVELIVPRHRSLFDYAIQQPMHNKLINPNVMFLAGNNLFISGFGDFIRKYGAVMFLREDAVIKKKGYSKVFLTKKRYINEVFPAYMKQEMFNGSDGNSIKKDMIIYAEQEKNPATRTRSGGRTKTGKLRNISYIFFDKLKALTKISSTKLYVTPVNISYSKVPDAPYIVHPAKNGKIQKVIRYIREQHFTYFNYPRFSHTHHDAKLDIVVHYGKPEILNQDSFSSMRDLLRYAKQLKEKIGLLESIFPLTLLYRAMDEDDELSLAECEKRMQILYDRYTSISVDVEKVSQRQGEMMSVEEIIEKSMRGININPPFHIPGVKGNRFLTCRTGRIHSHDMNLQTWYGNTIRHLDPQ
ncbi:MAG: 1-acyl-sn-glycerol-3-phosphate acyltransferase [Spirochaetales bacterium]|nr:1-acyl-sn-glycerol-3-phosphate acyltransferase [Spirochaetales bacterium]